MKAKKRILIVDDHPMFREGLKSIVARTDAFSVVGEAGTAREALEMARELRPDLVLLDISLPDRDGITLLREMRMVLSEAIFFMVSVYREMRYVAGSFQAGAKGYLVKESMPEQLGEALRIVAEGGYFFERSLAAKEVERLKGLAPKRTGDDLSRYASLTTRQKEIMSLVAQGLSCKSIGERLSIGTRTVETHRARIMEKLGVGNTAELIRFAASLGLADTNL